MSGYTSNDQITAVAQSCNRFSGRKKSRPDYQADAISCELCRHWDGIQCKNNVYDDILSNLDPD